MSITKEFAILAPVPSVHLASAIETCDREGQVAFGSNAWELFRQVEQMKKSDLVEVFIYPSLVDSGKPIEMKACWHGLYLDHVPSRRGRYPGDKRFRPESALSEKPTWAIFWDVCELTELSEDDHIPLSKFRGTDKKSDYALRTAPHSPIIVQYPF